VARQDSLLLGLAAPFALWCAVLAVAVAGQQPAPPERPSQRGEVIPAVRCAAQPDQSYALYLPMNYTADRRWPIVYVFEPFARGAVPLKLMSAAAARYGYILAASNNARNGPTAPELEAANAVWADTRSWLAIDDRRIYFAGLSGAARLASQLALNSKAAAGVFLNSAGFSGAAWPAQGSSLAVFALTGLEDFNYPEVIQLDAKLDSLGVPHFLRRFPGQHAWAPAGSWEEAFAWMDVEAMRQQRKPSDPAFLSAEFDRALARARSLAESREAYFAWQNYGEIAATFGGIVDTAPAAERARALENNPEVAAGRKAEAKDIDTQRILESDILGPLQQMAGDAGASAAPSPTQAAPQGSTMGTMGPMGSMGGMAPRPAAPDSLGAGGGYDSLQARAASQIRQLRGSATHENKPDKKRVFSRALYGVAVFLEERGDDCIRARQYHRADFYLELGVEAVPDWAWSHLSLARSYALEGNRKNALRELRRARELASDHAAFVEQLRSSDFDRLRDDPGFRSLTD